MGVPSSPATKTLQESLNVVGKVVKTSKYKFADWNIKLPKGTTKLPEAEFKKLSRAATFFREGHFTTEEIKKIQDAAKEAKTKVKEAEKLAKESKNLWDKFLSKAKGATQAAKAVDAGGTVAKSGAALAKFAPILTAIAAIGVSVAVNIIQGWRNDINEAGQEKLSASVSKILGLMNGQNQRIKLANEGVQAAKLENQRVKDRVYGLEKQLPGIRESVAEAKKKSNDALYETRAGKAKLEADIAEAKKKSNDALYETRTGRTKLELQIADVKKQSNDALYETRTGRTKLEDKIAVLQTQISKFTQSATGNFQAKLEVTIGLIQNRLSTTENKIAVIEKAKPTLQDKVIETVQASVKQVSTKLELLETGVKTIDPKIADLKAFTIKLVTGAVAPVEVKVNENTKKIQEVEKKYGVTTKSIEGVEKSLRDTYELSFEAQAAKWNEEMRQRKAEITTINQTITTTTTGGQIQQIKTDLDKTKVEVEKTKTDLDKTKVEVEKTKTDLDKTKVEVEKTKTDITKIDTKIKEQEKVNKEAIPKLDFLVGLVPRIPARAADAIRPSIATIPQIEQAAATGTCRTLQPGGCGAKALDGLGNSVNQNTNNQSNNLFDKLNAGANAVQLGLLKVIDNKLGAQIAGGISGKLVDGFKWLHLDRVLSLLTFAATVQNHLMLSNDIGQTLIGAFTNVLTLIGLKDDKGQGFDVGSVINSTVENFVKGIVGAENYTTISSASAKANRIYQATTNVLNSFLSLSQTILQANELIAAHTGKIGNALKKGGVVLENAYGWMNPQPKFNRVTSFLEGLQQGASTIQMVTQAPLDVVNATTELTTASTAFVTAIKEDNNPANKAVTVPEPDQLKTKEQESKTNSQPKPFDFSDLFDGED